MNSLRFIIRRQLCFVLLAAIGLGLAGCATEESSNESTRPWNSPEGWQNGSLPAGMIQPR
jgi:hypothetical protein